MSIDIIHTPCKNCTFAKFEQNTQTGCELGYLDIYKNRSDLEILEVYDESKEFFVINKKKCIGYREDKWFKQYGDQELSMEQKINLYFEKNKISYAMVINLKDANQTDLENIIDQIQKLSIKPEKIILVRYPPSNNEILFPYEYIKNIIDTLNINWKIQTVVDPNITYEFMLHNITTTNKKYRFIVSINNQCDNIDQVINYANDVICKNLNSFEIISNKTKSCIIFPSIVYRYAMFMYKQNILEDINRYTFI